MTYRIALIGLLVAGGCYAGYGQQQQTLPEPVQVGGPPGGQMDPTYYQNPNQPQDPQGYAQQGDPNNQYQGEPSGDPNMAQDPNDPNAQGADQQPDPQAMADVDDTEIDATLQGYGTWDQDADYGQVWRPDATLVGADFTPYDTCGSWVNTAYGMTFNCDYNWGWLPFHYGRWGWFGNGWGWVRGHQWGPAWVDWRHGNGMVGWRPTGPEGGHRPPMDSHWHFQHEAAFGQGHIRGRELNNPAEGLHSTQPVTHAPTLGRPQVHVGHVMGTRHSPGNLATNGNGGLRRPAPTQAFRQPQPAYRQPAYRQPQYRQPPQQYRQPAYRQTYQQRPTYQQQPRPTYQQPRPTYQQRPTYTQRPSYNAPSRPSYSAPSHFTAPSHSSGSSSAPSHSSSSSSSHSSSSSSHSSSGGHHR